MTERPESARPGDRADDGYLLERRRLLKTGAKLAYIAPVVLAALKATPAQAVAISQFDGRA